MEILKIHAAPIAKHGDIDYESVRARMHSRSHARDDM